MPLRDAILELRGRLKALRGRLDVLTALTEGIGGGGVHVLVDQVDKSAVDALGWVNAAAKATRKAGRPAAPGDAIRIALTDAQLALDRLKRKEPRRLRGRRLKQDLADLGDRHGRGREAGLKRVGEWAKEAAPAVRAFCSAARAAEVAMADCWRELANRPAGGRVRVKTITVVG